MLEKRNAGITALIAGIKPQLDGVQVRYRERLRERLQRLDVQADPERLEQELALIAQRVDVAEEIDRLASHVAEIQAILHRNEPIGRRLDFVIQELNREANTFASKVQEEALTRVAGRAQGAHRADARAGAEPRVSKTRDTRRSALGRLRRRPAPARPRSCGRCSNASRRCGSRSPTRLARGAARRSTAEDYFFVTEPQFLEMVRDDAFLEHARVFDHWYGTGREHVAGLLAAGFSVVLEIDWQGARQVRERAPESQSVFILPPSVAELERRLRGRKTDSEAVIQRRLKDALGDMTHWTEFDHVIVNEDFAAALGAVGGRYSW